MKKIVICCLIIVSTIGFDRLNCQTFYDTGIPNKYVQENLFKTRKPDTVLPPTFTQVKSKLPSPYWPAHPGAIEAYWRIWELQFKYLHQVSQQNRFVSPFVEPPFNGYIFMWDACFMTMFGRYGERAFNFQQTLDNFYGKQHKDGFICREISIEKGEDHFEKFDPSSTGPNLMPWAEWEYYLNLNDTARLREVFPPLLAYYQWYRTHRSWPDGSYFSSGWGSGMDNQPRLPKEERFDPRFSTGFMSWIDINLQQILVGKILVQIAVILNRTKDVQDIEFEISQLTDYVQKNMWDEKTAFFYDRYRDGSLSNVKSIASFWSLLAGVVPEKSVDEYISHLENPAEFARVHRVATLSADVPGYDPGGGYWNGAIWAPTNYMVLRGLTKYGKDSLAHAIALNHLQNVVQVFEQTGTFWENYAPDFVLGSAMKDFVDWNGLIPISDMFEYVFGIRPDVPQNKLIIDVRLTDEYGIKNYPFGKTGLLDIHCNKRKSESEKPVIIIQTKEPLTLIVRWKNGELVKRIQSGRTKM